MKSHNSSWNSLHVDQFVNLVAQARAHNSKEVRMSMSDAAGLCDAILHLLLQERELTQALLRAQERVIHNTQNSTTSREINLNGGSF